MKTVFRHLSVLIATLVFAQIVRAQPTTFDFSSVASFGPHGNGTFLPGDSIGTNPRNTNDIQISAPGGFGIQAGETDVRTGGPTNGFDMRGLTYDPVSGNLVFVDEHSGSGGAVGGNYGALAAIYVLDSSSGQIIGVLNTNGITGGNFTTTAAAVADDGSVFIGNQSFGTTATTIFKIYRWPTANIHAANFSEAPVVVFSSNVTNVDALGQTMDIRGSGTNIQIICGSSSIRTGNGNPGTNIVVFTTTDGTNLTAHKIFYPTLAVGGPYFNDGIAFGPGNTFFAKRVGLPLLYLGYDGTNYGAGTVLASYTASSPNDPLLNLSALAYDPVNHLLAGMEEIGGTATGGNGKVWLYDFPDPVNHPPALLDNRVFTQNFQKTTAPMGYLKFGGGRLYANASNNGLMANNVTATTLSAPSYTWTDYNLTGQTVTRVSDLPATTRAAVGSTAHFEVFALSDVTNYQWYSNSVPIAGANSYFLNVTNVQTNMSGTIYQVTAINAAGSTPSTASTLTVISPADYYHLNPIWAVTANTVALTDNTNFITSNAGSGTPNERCIAYNAISNQLLVVRGPTLASLKIFVVNADTGLTQYRLNTNGITASQTLTLAGIGVGDDGAVYACSTAASDTSFKVYRWADTGSNTLPQVIFGTNSSAASGNPVADQTGTTLYRFGDVLAVHGAGVNTEIVVDNQNAPTKYVGILRPQNDGTMTNWTQTGYVMQNQPGSYGYGGYGTTIGRSLQFGPVRSSSRGDVPTIWQKRYNLAAGAPLSGMGYTAGGGVAELLVANTTLPLYTNGPMGINFVLNVGAALNFVGAPGTDSTTTQDTLDYYDMTDPAQAVLLSKNPLPGGNGGFHKGNGNAVGQVIFGVNPATGTNYVFALDGNNGVAGYTLSGGVTPPPRILTQPHNQNIITGTGSALNVVVDQAAAVEWYKGTNTPVDTGIQGLSYAIANAQPSDAGDYFVIATNVNGSVTSLVAHVTISLATDHYTLTPVWTAPAGNPSYPYVSSDGGANTPNERSFTYNAVSNQLIVVRCPPASTSYSLTVVNADTGASLYSLNTNGIIHEGASEVTGANAIDMVGVAAADDGALYVCSESPNASGGISGDTTKMYHVFRWANTGASTAPTLVYEGDPSSQPPNSPLRWGDVMAARGSGTNTELIVNAFEGLYGAVLKPKDASMAAFTNYWFVDSGGGGSIGRSIQFGAGNTAYEKRKGASLVISSYNTNNQTSAVINGYDFTTTQGGLFVDATRHVAAGVDFVGSTTTPLKPDALSFYDVTDLSAPLLVSRTSFPSNQVGNANFICQTIITSNRVYTLDGNNGMMALAINNPASWKPTISASPTNLTVSAGGTAAFHVVAATGSNGGSLTYQWKGPGNVTLSDGSSSGGVVSGATTADLTIANVAAGAAGTYAVTVSNPYGSTNSAAATLTVNTVTITPVHLTAGTSSGTNMVLSGTGGAANGTFSILVATNIPLAATNWGVYISSNLDGSGNFSLNIPIQTNPPTRFFIIKEP